MTKFAVNPSDWTDADLVAASVAGDRGAFGAIVVRYQTLIASLAYSATGNLAQSEDLSQETFLAAWQQLARLREPAKLRSWLCGIVRNLNLRAQRDRRTEPAVDALPLTAEHDAPSRDAAPAEHAISREEEGILWRSLERIPENYREPLILFYRQQQSIERVAEVLEISEEAARQRLSRGRKLLEGEVAAFVEGALRQSAPGRNFAAAVLASLPLAPGVAIGTAGATGGPGAAAGGKAGGLIAAVAPSLVGLFASLLGSVELVRLAETPAVRRFTRRLTVAMWLDCVALWIALVLTHWWRWRDHWSDAKFVGAQVGCYWLWAAIMAALVIRFWRCYVALLPPPSLSRAVPSLPNRRRGGIVATLAMTVGSLAWLVRLAWAAADFFSCAVAMGAAVGAIVWVQVLPDLLARRGIAPLRVAWVPAALIGGVILLLVNFRVTRWIAAVRMSDLADAQRFLPPWIVHLGTVFFLLWTGAMVAFTRPSTKPASS